VVRKTIRLPDDLNDKIVEFSRKNGYKNWSEGARALLIRGLENE